MPNTPLFSSVVTASPVTSISVSISSESVASILSYWTDVTPGSQAVVSVNVGASSFNIPSHGFLNGLKVLFSTSGNPPAPLATFTAYYVIVLDSNNIQLAATQANATAITPVPITLTSAGSGVFTIVPQPLSGQLQVYGSVNGTNFSKLPKLIHNFSIGNGNNILEQELIDYNYIQLVASIFSGQVDISADLTANPLNTTGGGGSSTVNQGNPNTIANAWPVEITDTTNTLKVNADGSINVDSNASSATTPVIYNVSVPTAGVEVSQTLPANTKKLLIKVRNSTARLQFSFASGQSGSDYVSLSRGTSFEVTDIDVPSLTIYFQVNEPSQTVEILAWS